MKSTLIAALIAASLITAVPVAGDSENTRVPVVLELFTSEGCSSCPPADRLLEALDRQPVANADLIVLSEHVDYWNYLGWSDPYSSAVFSARQHDYSARLGSTVYTPQLVVDGHLQALGSDREEVMAAIGSATRNRKVPLAIRAIRSETGVSVHIDANHTGPGADLFVVVAADHARSQVLRGENGGHMLSHVAVVQSITRAGKWDGATDKDIVLPLKSVAAPGEARIIAILQDSRSGRILGAARTRI